MAFSKIRQAVVAGQFYPASAQAIKSQISGFISKQGAKADAIACMLPHAGYIYSGRVAAQTVSKINVKEKVILLGPNHTGRGPDFSIMPEGAWLTPLGRVNIDTPLARAIMEAAGELEDDLSAHSEEHSLEVELPVLQYFKQDFEIVPIAFMSDDLAALKKVGEGIAGAIKKSGLRERVLLVASSDMTHYEPQAEAVKKDKLALEAILGLDPERLAREVRLYNISMCGVAPVIAMLSAAEHLGAKEAELVKYQTSGDVTGDKSSVVGYAGVIIK